MTSDLEQDRYQALLLRAVLAKRHKKGKEAMKKVMISQPMAGKTEKEIAEVRNHAIAALEAKGYEVPNTWFLEQWKNRESLSACGVVYEPVHFLSKALDAMSCCHAVYFCRGWQNARGCRIEHTVALSYGVEILYEEDEANG